MSETGYRISERGGIYVCRPENGFRRRKKSILGIIQGMIASVGMHQVSLLTPYGMFNLMIPYNEMMGSYLAARILNIRHEGFLRILEKEDIPYEKSGEIALVNSNDFMKFKNKWNGEREGMMERIGEIDSEDDYDSPFSCNIEQS